MPWPFCFYLSTLFYLIVGCCFCCISSCIVLLFNTRKESIQWALCLKEINELDGELLNIYYSFVHRKHSGDNIKILLIRNTSCYRARLLVKRSSDRSCSCGMVRTNMHLISPGYPQPSAIWQCSILD